MKKFPSAALFAKNPQATLILVLAIFSFIALACSGGGSKSTGTPLPAGYVGGWTSKEGASLQLTSDGLGYYRNGGTTVSGAAAQLDDTGKILKLTFVGVSVKEFKIDQEPKGGKMTLDGVVYQLNGGATTQVSDSPSSNSGSETDADLPSTSEQKEMTKTAIQDFTDAVEKGDFADFRDNCATSFQDNVSTAKFNQIFDTFIKQKKPLVPILRSSASMTPDYSPATHFIQNGDTKVLDISGTYATTPLTTFELQYVSEDDDWKLNMIKVRVEPPSK